MFNRLRVVYIFFSLGLVLVTARLFYWQVYKGKGLSEDAIAQYADNRYLHAKRGEILSKDGSWLAATTDAYLVYASIPEIDVSINHIAEKLAPLFLSEEDQDENYKSKLLAEVVRLKSLLSKKEAVWVPLKQKVDGELKVKIEELKIKGIGFELQEKRFYPEGSTAAQLLGFLGKDKEGEDVGYFGLEGFYDLALSGKTGFLIGEKDPFGSRLTLGDSKEVLGIEGVDLWTNIEKRIQLTLEKELKSGIERYGASGGTVIVMDPKDGSIFGSASYPSYEPGNYVKYSDQLFSDPSIAFSFEPGSIFKVLVMASAIDAGAVTPETICTSCNGPVRIGSYTIETWNQVYHPDSSMSDIIINSDNVGMVFVAQKLGASKMYEYLKAFGIGDKTGIDLQGESAPRLRDSKEWGEIELATASFGQGIAVTPIEMIRGVAAIANGGYLVTPQIVDKIKIEGWEDDIKPVISNRVISEKASKIVTSMMVEAAKRGESKWTNVSGFRVAGKTGTAQIPIEGHYDKEKTIASFIGFAPFNDPKFIMLLTLREPKSSNWASETAAPLWYSIAKDLFVYFGIQPEN